MTRGEVWLAEVGRKRRPVLVLTRTEVLDVRSLVTVAEISTSARGLAAEVEIDHVAVGLDEPRERLLIALLRPGEEFGL